MRYACDMGHRTYDQYCPVAAALDVVGDRWTLLIMRELLTGDRRFTDLRTALPGIAPNLLSERLRDLQAEGLVEHKELPPPAARTVYAATADGRDGRAGAAVAGPLRCRAARPAGRRRRADAAHGGVRDARRRSTVPSRPASASTPASMVDGETFDVLTDGARLSLRRRPDATPDVAIEITARDLVAARQGSRRAAGQPGARASPASSSSPDDAESCGRPQDTR